MSQNQDHEISIVNNLVTTTIDSADGFERSAENLQGHQFEQMFRKFAQERRQIVGRLQDYVQRIGGSPNHDGSLTASLHRRFEDLRTAIGGGDKAVMEEVERGESYIKGKYDEALKDNELSPECRSVIQEAYRSIRAGHDEALQLKQSFQSAS